MISLYQANLGGFLDRFRSLTRAAADSFKGVSVGSKLFPPEIRSTALAFVFVFAQMGGSIFPVATGVLASHSGVAVLQPMLVGLLGATAIAWLLIPRPKATANPALHQE